MSVLISYLTALLRKHDIHNLNSIATSVYCGDYTVPEAVQIYRLNVKDVEYIANVVNKYYEHENYIQERARGNV